MYLGFMVHCYKCRGGEGNEGNDRDGSNDSDGSVEDVGRQEGFVCDDCTIYY